MNVISFASLFNIGVAVGPGAKPLTVIPYGANVFAKPKVNPLIPHLLKVYAEAAGRREEEEAMLRMFPLILCKAGNACLHLSRSFYQQYSFYD